MKGKFFLIFYDLWALFRIYLEIRSHDPFQSIDAWNLVPSFDVKFTIDFLTRYINSK